MKAFESSAKHLTQTCEIRNSIIFSTFNKPLKASQMIRWTFSIKNFFTLRLPSKQVFSTVTLVLSSGKRVEFVQSKLLQRMIGKRDVIFKSNKKYLHCSHTHKIWWFIWMVIGNFLIKLVTQPWNLIRIKPVSKPLIWIKTFSVGKLFLLNKSFYWEKCFRTIINNDDNLIFLVSHFLFSHPENYRLYVLQFFSIFNFCNG